MIYPIYCVRDLKGDFWSPRVEQNDASAERDFALLVNEPNTLISQFPQDFEFYKVGMFDSSSGIIKQLDLPLFIKRGTDVVGVTYEK